MSCCPALIYDPDRRRHSSRGGEAAPSGRRHDEDLTTSPARPGPGLVLAQPASAARPARAGLTPWPRGRSPSAGPRSTASRSSTASRRSRRTAAPMMHLHGFGLSGRYLLPTAERLAGEFHTLVPDLPGFGRSGRALHPLDVPDLAARRSGLPRRPGARVGHARRQLDGLPGHLRVRPPLPGPDRPRHPRLAGRRAAQPTAAARDHASWPATASASRRADAGRRPRLPALRRAEHPAHVPRPDPVTRRSTACSQLEIPTLVVVGERDPLMPAPPRIKEIAGQTDNHVLLVVIHGAAHAINFSHPGELANVIRQFMADQPIVRRPRLAGPRPRLRDPPRRPPASAGRRPTGRLPDGPSARRPM